MKRFLLAAAGAAALGSGAAQAGEFNFSYTFGDSTAFTASFDGTRVGDSVEGVSNVQAWLNGTALNGPLLVGAWDSAATSFDTAVAPTISLTNVALDNFIFADGTTPLGSDTTNWFYLVNSPDLLALGAPAVFAALVDGTAAADDVPGGAASLSVPEPMTALLFPAGLGLLGVLRRRRARAAI